MFRQRPEAFVREAFLGISSGRFMNSPLYLGNIQPCAMEKGFLAPSGVFQEVQNFRRKPVFRPFFTKVWGQKPPASFIRWRTSAQNPFSKSKSEGARGVLSKIPPDPSLLVDGNVVTPSTL
ncbi:hypothetical protein GWK47_048463 [Chionoecetes opilio]|uniref:Uncharacterized protein n=1 Tax=Chionoecetes opilio TaxID=41210 RepID=A0A8J5CTV3_CHIOP|nr:hypothetical protein GWK47_048463 [Chionoecetes opilio]